jgi:hypothetical protein
MSVVTKCTYVHWLQDVIAYEFDNARTVMSEPDYDYCGEFFHSLCFDFLIKHNFKSGRFGCDTDRQDLVDEINNATTEIYRTWLSASLDYYFLNVTSSMSDDEWTQCAKWLYSKINEFPFLQSVDFNGTTLGVGVTKEMLEKEIKRIESNIART